jgi:hypothetical protein
MDTLFDLPVMDIIAGFIVVLIALFVVMAIIAWQQCQRANHLAAELETARFDRRIMYKQLDALISYVKIHPHTWQQPGFPPDDFTLSWMTSVGVKKKDAQALIYKYLAKALRPDENN